MALLTLKELAIELKCSERMLWKLLAQRRLPVDCWIGNQRRFVLEAVRAALRERPTAPVRRMKATPGLSLVAATLKREVRTWPR